MGLELHGFRYSVYLRIAAMALIERKLGWTHVEIDPFTQSLPQAYLALNPFGRVPTLIHDGFVVYETTAITRYIDEAFPAAALQPTDARERARMNQIIAVADHYAYWPMVRQVFSQRVFGPTGGEQADEAVVGEGLARSAKALAGLESLVGGGRFLVGGSLSLADLHLGAMTAYFTMAAEGRDELARHLRLREWWASFSAWPSLVQSDPGLPAS